MIERSRKLGRRATAMTFVVALQCVAALFFLVDFAGDVAREGLGGHLAIEGAAALALPVGVLFGALQLRALVLAARQDAVAVATAKGAMAELIRLRFAEWRLTPAEADVALFAIKGCDAAEIAALRGAAPGTVRAQLTKVYAKARVSSQSALIALFIDDLIDPADVRDAAGQGA